MFLILHIETSCCVVMGHCMNQHIRTISLKLKVVSLHVCVLIDMGPLQFNILFFGLALPQNRSACKGACPRLIIETFLKNLLRNLRTSLKSDLSKSRVGLTRETGIVLL